MHRSVDLRLELRALHNAYHAPDVERLLKRAARKAKTGPTTLCGHHGATLHKAVGRVAFCFLELAAIATGGPRDWDGDGEHFLPAQTITPEQLVHLAQHFGKNPHRRLDRVRDYLELERDTAVDLLPAPSGRQLSALHGSLEPTEPSGHRRAGKLRAVWFLKQYEAEGTDTYHSPSTIARRWRDLSIEQRKAISPLEYRVLKTEGVRKAIMRERERRDSPTDRCR